MNPQRQRQRQRQPSRDRQRGALFLALAILVVMAMAYALVTPDSGAMLAQARARTTNKALSDAKSALLAWSAARGDSGAPNARPGELPCPDANGDGLADAVCAAGQLGRLPWRTLGLAPLTDADGEALWYAVGAGFRPAALDAGAINSDRSGPMQLFDSGGAVIAQGPSGLAAVVVAPGAPLAGQVRPSNQATDHVEAALGQNNATAGGPYVTGPLRVAGSLALNDTIVGLAASELLRVAERRALTEAQHALSAYQAAHASQLPNAAAPGDALCLAPIPNVAAANACPAEAGRCKGRLPEDALAPHAAAWFTGNGWGRVIAYAVRSDAAVDASGPDCGAALSVDAANARAVFIAAGTPGAGQARPSTLLASYLDDAGNADAWSGTPAAGAFVAPALGNDQLRSLP